MLHILLLILKIIGIILLAILGILVFVICVILFVPAHYQIKAETADGVEQLALHAKAHWLFHLLSAHVDYEQKNLNWQVRLVWKKLNQEEAEEEEKEMQSEPAAKDVTEDAGQDTAKEHVEEAGEEPCEESCEEPREEKSSKEKTVKKEKWYEKIKCTIRKICDKIKLLWEMKEKVLDFLSDEIHKIAFARVKKELLILLKRISPRKIRGYVRFGLEDPYNTGKVLAGLSVLYPFYGENVQIYPEFEEEILEGDLFVRGKIGIISLVQFIWKLFFDKNIRRTYKDFKSLKQRYIGGK